MPRSKKATVDYFPHSCNHGKTIHIIESKYGNDGYAFWFKLLELLGSTENHFLDCNDPATWEYLLARTRLTGENATFLLNLLAALDSINEKFWKIKIIWSDKFVKNLEAVYERRRINLFTTANIEAYCQQKRYLNGKNVNINPQSKVKESKVKESKGEYYVRFLKFYELYPNKTSKKEAEKSFNKINPDDELLKKMLTAISWQKQTEKWREKKGKYVPMPSTWLNQERWNDEMPQGIIPETEAEKIAKFGPAEMPTEEDIKLFHELFPGKEISE